MERKSADAKFNTPQVIYDPEIFNEKVMEKMQNTYKTLLELSTRLEPVTLNELPIMPRYLTIPPAQTPDKFIAVHDMIRMHAINNPDRIALSCAEKNQDMSYGELDNTSTLRAHGTCCEGEWRTMKRLTMNT